MRYLKKEEEKKMKKRIVMLFILVKEEEEKTHSKFKLSLQMFVKQVHGTEFRSQVDVECMNIKFALRKGL